LHYNFGVIYYSIFFDSIYHKVEFSMQHNIDEMNMLGPDLFYISFSTGLVF